MTPNELLPAIMLFLFAAVVAVPVAQRIGMGTILGFLSAGIVIGPWGFGFIQDVTEILHFSELGVVFLLFIIGLELKPSKLWNLRHSIFGIGVLQMVLVTIVLGSILFFYSFSWQAALIGGIGLAMSSTAMALQLMREKGLFPNEGGQLGFSILLFQDMAVVPALALIPLLCGASYSSDNWITLIWKVSALLGMLVFWRFLLRPIFRYVADTGVREIFTAAALLVVLGSAVLMDQLGFSMALGTFIAGVLLAESEFQHELEIAIEPFKGLLLGLFFISVGMVLNIGVLYTNLLLVITSVIILVTIKGVILYLLTYLAGIRGGIKLQIAAVLSQGGEFAFVLFSSAKSNMLFSDSEMALLLIIVTLSMATTPLFMLVVDAVLSRRYNARVGEEENHYVINDNPQVIIVGFGRFGQVIGRLLMANKMIVTVLERDIGAISTLRRYGYKVYYGDATHLELLRAAGAEKAKAIVITCNLPEDTLAIVQLCQQYFPHLSILARVHGRVEAHELLQMGVTLFARETFSSALELGFKTLVTMGMHPYQAYRSQQLFRRLDLRMLKELMPQQNQGEGVTMSRVKEARRELEEIFQSELQYERSQLSNWDEYFEK